MRILANENVAGEAVRALRERGHDVEEHRVRMTPLPSLGRRVHE